MIIDILVHIESREDVECVAKVNLPWNRCIALKNWEKVCGVDYRIHMNDRHDPILVTIEIGFNNPHAIVRIRIIEGLAKMVNECA